MFSIRRHLLPTRLFSRSSAVFASQAVRLSSSKAASFQVPEIQVPFDDQPFPFNRFEPCCPDSEAKQFDNGYVPCKQHPMPNVIGSKIEFSDDMRIVPPVSKRHMVVCVGPEGAEWTKSKVESLKGGFVLEMESAKNEWLKSRSSSSSNRKNNEPRLDMLVTVCDKPTSKPSGTDILLFPDFRRYTSVDPSRLKESSFMNVLQKLWEEPTASELPDVSNCEAVDDLDAVVLVCTHTMRDKRCGVLGPLIVQEFERVLKEKGLNKVGVYGTSHFGGSFKRSNNGRSQRCIF